MSDRPLLGAAGRGPGPDVRARIGSLRLANPVLCASGTFGYGIEEPEAARRLGGIVTKTITREPRAGRRSGTCWGPS